MSWRKYTTKEGKHGPIYYIARGLQIRKNPQKKWVLFIEKNGLRKNKTFGTGREELSNAIKAGEALASKFGSKSVSENRDQAESIKPLFRVYSEKWLENGSGRWHENTFERYGGLLRNHIWPFFKNKRLDEINRSFVKEFLRELLKIRSAKTVELAQVIIYGVFDEAIDDEILETNPARAILKKVLPPQNKRSVLEPDPFEMEERDLFLETAAMICPWTQVMILKLMAFGGFRLGETLALRLENLNFNKRNYHITESYKLKKFGLPKKGKKRLVDLPDFLIEEMRGYITHLKKESLKKGEGAAVDLLFIDPNENERLPFSQRKVQGIMKKVCKKAGLRIRNPHDLRHTYASILLMSGTSPAYVQQQLGHSSISTTCDIYGHWVPGEGRKDLEESLCGSVQQSHIAAYNKKRLQ